jgi:CRISPR-associated protein Csm4
MKVCEITIKPLSGFGTPLKGDTIFGHLCWQAAYDNDLFGKPIAELLAGYDRDPFLITSSAYPKFHVHGKAVRALKRPDLPVQFFLSLEGENAREIIGQRKAMKAKTWMTLVAGERIESLRSMNYLDDLGLLNHMGGSGALQAQGAGCKVESETITRSFLQTRNAVNRTTGATAAGAFAPFGVEQSVFIPGMELALLAAISDDISPASVEKALVRVGETGYGKDASIGLGRFEVTGMDEVDLGALGSHGPNACYTLGPCVPDKSVYRRTYYKPFIRFGRHGDVLAKSKNPFKNPVIMADEGAVLEPLDRAILHRPYIGTGVMHVSKTEPNSVTQGYTLYIPVTVET